MTFEEVQSLETGIIIPVVVITDGKASLKVAKKISATHFRVLIEKEGNICFHRFTVSKNNWIKSKSCATQYVAGTRTEFQFGQLITY